MNNTAAISMAILNRTVGDGALTQLRKRRTLVGYTVFFIVGLLPLLFSSDAALQAAGIGLWFPGAGFLAVGGWWALLLPLTLIVFVISLIAWLGSGMLLAPIIIWLGSAALSGALASTEIWPYAPYTIVVVLMLLKFRSGVKSKQRQESQLQLQAERKKFLSQAVKEVVARAVPAQPSVERELTMQQLSSLRYCIDRGL